MDRYAGSWQDMEEKGDTLFHTDNTANRNLKPVLNWVKDCFANLVRVFSSNLKNVRRTWLVGRTLLREPSSGYSSNCDEAVFTIR